MIFSENRTIQRQLAGKERNHDQSECRDDSMGVVSSNYERTGLVPPGTFKVAARKSWPYARLAQECLHLPTCIHVLYQTLCTFRGLFGSASEFRSSHLPVTRIRCYKRCRTTTISRKLAPPSPHL